MRFFFQVIHFEAECNLSAKHGHFYQRAATICYLVSRRYQRTNKLEAIPNPSSTRIGPVGACLETISTTPFFQIGCASTWFFLRKTKMRSSFIVSTSRSLVRTLIRTVSTRIVESMPLTRWRMRNERRTKNFVRTTRWIYTPWPLTFTGKAGRVLRKLFMIAEINVSKKGPVQRLKQCSSDSPLVLCVAVHSCIAKIANS